MRPTVLILLLLIFTLIQAGCACAPLGPKTLPTGEDKYSAKYD
jgi:hypothetical protein